MGPVFDRCFERLMILEGHAFTNNPDDHGGPTKFGISKLSYPEEDIENLTLARAKELYHRDFYIPAGCHQIQDERMAFQLFETAVHMDPRGFPRRATLAVQRALLIHRVEILVDGIMGPKTIKAINEYQHKDSLLKWANIIQGAMLIVGSAGDEEFMGLLRNRVDQLQTFGRGWGRRIEV